MKIVFIFDIILQRFLQTSWTIAFNQFSLRLTTSRIVFDFWFLILSSAVSLCSTRNYFLFNSVFVLRLLINHSARLEFVFYSFQFLFCNCQQTNLRCFQLFIKLFYFFFQAVMSFSHQLIKYRIASKLTIVNNEIAIENRQFENIVIIVEWCKDVKDDKTQIERLKVVRDFVFKQ